MSQHGKKYRGAVAKVEQKPYPLADAIRLVTETSYAKFDETVEIAMRLGVDPKHADQMVRGTVLLPHGLGRTSRVLVFAQGEKIKEAEDAGADYVGGDELAKKIEGGWLDFESVVATPDGHFGICASGGRELSKGGSGDVLAGMIAALLAARAYKADPFVTAGLGTYLHGAAGAHAAADRHPASVLATEVTENIPKALSALTFSHQKGTRSR